MMKQAIKLNDSIELCHRQITNSGREIVGLKIVDVETGAWDLFDLDRGQVSQLVEWLSDWLEQSATTCDLTNPAPIEACRTEKRKTWDVRSKWGRDAGAARMIDCIFALCHVPARSTS